MIFVPLYATVSDGVVEYHGLRFKALSFSRSYSAGIRPRVTHSVFGFLKSLG